MRWLTCPRGEPPIALHAALRLASSNPGDYGEEQRHGKPDCCGPGLCFAALRDRTQISQSRKLSHCLHEHRLFHLHCGSTCWEPSRVSAMQCARADQPQSQFDAVMFFCGYVVQPCSHPWLCLLDMLLISRCAWYHAAVVRTTR